MLVRRRQSDLSDVVPGREHGRPHLPQRLLQRAAVHQSEPLQQDLPHLPERLSPRHVRFRVSPPRGQRRGQDPVGRLRQRRVAIPEEAGELRPGRLQHDEVPDTRDNPLSINRSLGVDDRGSGPYLVAGSDERVRVAHAVDSDPLPAVLVDFHAGAGHRLDVVGEVARQRQRVVLDLADAPLLGEGETRVLLRVGRQHLGLVAGQVRGGEVAAERRRYVEVADLVPIGVAVDAHDSGLGLAVLVVAEHDRHR